MGTKPASQAGYTAEASQLAWSASLYIATKLGDLRDDVVIVGGLVPSLLVPPADASSDRPKHIGTMDVDLGLAVAILNEQRYQELSERLSAAGFQPDSNEAGRTISQRWTIRAERQLVSVDFLIPPTLPGDKGGMLRNLEDGFSAIITPGLELAFVDKRLVTLQGQTLHNESAERQMWVCEAGAYLVLKALAFRGRGENKDAYDLTYLVQNYGESIRDVFERLCPLLENSVARQALDILEQDFAHIDAVGIRRLAEFFGDASDEAMRADAAAAVRSLLRLCRETDASQ
ncbi:MAG: hypothetical protein R3C99_18205 [Pirellulaceae bacterium]